MGKRSFAISTITPGLHAAHFSDEGLELGGAAEVLPGEWKLVLLGGDIHGQFHMSVGIGQECPEKFEDFNRKPEVSSQMISS